MERGELRLCGWRVEPGTPDPQNPLIEGEMPWDRGGVGIGDVPIALVPVAIVSAVLRDFQLRLADVLLVGPRQVPKTSSGKKQRSAARDLWLAGRELPGRESVDAGAPV